MMAQNDELPQALRDAADQYANWDEEEWDEEEEVEVKLFEAFGIKATGDDAHRRAVWLCVLVVRRVLYGWDALECEGNQPAMTIEVISRWVQQGISPQEWEPWCTPAPAKRHGLVIQDCDACRAEPIASAAANAARFAQSASLEAAAEVLHEVGAAASEGVHWPDAMSFEEWVVKVALPAGYNLRDLEAEELYA